jgi:hypothetical protein
MNEHLSFQKALDPKTLFFCLSNAKKILDFNMVHLQSFKLFERTQNEEDMVVKSKQSQCSIINLIHI